MPGLVETGPVVLKKIVNLVNVLPLFLYYLPLEKDNKLESPSPKNDLCQVWLKLVQWFCGRSFTFQQSIFAIS